MHDWLSNAMFSFMDRVDLISSLFIGEMSVVALIENGSSALILFYMF